MYPNLTDDDWLWGGGMDQIHETLVQGRKGFMPAFGQVLKPEQLDDVAEYVLTLSGETQAQRSLRARQGDLSGSGRRLLLLPRRRRQGSSSRRARPI
jgi:cytochrome c oxidase cbb3-type subunit 3